MNRYIKILLLFVLTLTATTTLFAQEHALGVRGSMVMGSINFEPARFTKLNMGGYGGSLVYTYDGMEKYYGSIQAEIGISQRGFTTMPREESDSLYTRNIISLEIPFLWRPNITFAHDKVIVYAVLGTYLYYDISSTWKQEDIARPDSDYNDSGKWEYDSLRDNRLGVGIVGGIGVGVNISKRIRISTEARYVYAFSNIFKPAAKYEGNPVQSTPNQITISFGLSYLF